MNTNLKAKLQRMKDEFVIGARIGKRYKKMYKARKRSLKRDIAANMLFDIQCAVYRHRVGG